MYEKKNTFLLNIKPSIMCHTTSLGKMSGQWRCYLSNDPGLPLFPPMGVAPCGNGWALQICTLARMDIWPKTYFR